MTTVRIRLARDLPTWLVYLQLGAFATYLYGLSAVLPLLRQEQQVSNAVAALHGTAMAAGTLLAGAVLPLLERKYGRRATIWVSLIGMNAAMVPIMLTGALPATLAGYGVAGLFGSMALYAMMAALSDHHGPAGPAAISEANAVAILFGIAMTYAVGAAAQTAPGWRAALLVTPAVTGVLALTLGRVRVAGRPATGGRSASGARPGWRFYVAGGVLFLVVALEFCFNLWAVQLLSANTGLSVAAATTGLTAFTVGLAVGRFAGTPLALRIRAPALLTGALLLTAAGWLLLWSSEQPLLAYAGLAVSGLGVSLHFPLALAGVLAVDPARATAASPVCAGLAMAAGPFALGALADGFGTRTAFLIVPVLIALAVTGLVLSGGPRTPAPSTG
ncbi:MFS transporter [Nonomuraea typhae]|uniref:MFS transporter n=1 Tax=Nonomuraea typhae TaxID=2603600 RepID=A0ABW7YW64_9ACTN